MPRDRQHARHDAGHRCRAAGRCRRPGAAVLAQRHKPITRLTQKMGALAQGDLEVGPGADRTDEVGEMARRCRC